MGLSEFERAIERRTGLSVEDIRQTPIDVLSRKREANFGTRLQIIGSAIVRLLSREEINQQLDQDLGKRSNE